MTTDEERLRSINSARQFMDDLLFAKTRPKTVAELRKRAYWILRHFPEAWWVDLLKAKKRVNK